MSDADREPAGTARPTAAGEPSVATAPSVAVEPTTGRALIATGASAGGVEALRAPMSKLPGDLKASVLVVLHVMAGGRSMLPQILSRSGPLPAVTASDGQILTPGHVYVAPPDHHLLVHDGTMHLSHGPLENGHRPAIDPLFRSAARAYGPQVIGVVLSGLLDDGAAGLRYIKDRGGAVVVQDPADALFSNMPKAACAATPVDRIASVAEMAAVLVDLVGDPDPESDPEGTDDPPAAEDLDTVEKDPTGLALVEGSTPTPFSCPACGGTMWESSDGPVLRFICQVGHAYSADSMLSEQGTAVERAMWSAVRVLEERAELLGRIARRQSGGSKTRLQDRAAAVQAQARDLRGVLLTQPQSVAPTDDA